MSVVEPTPVPPLQTTVVPNREEVAVVASGEIDMASAPQVAHEVQALQAAGFRQIVVDLHQVGFIDSVGLRMLLDMRAELARDGYVLTLVPPQPTAQRIFEITQTTPLFAWRDRFSA